MRNTDSLRDAVRDALAREHEAAVPTPRQPEPTGGIPRARHPRRVKPAGQRGRQPNLARPLRRRGG